MRPRPLSVHDLRNVSDEQLSQALEGKCRVLKLDSDEEEDMAGTLNVSSAPGKRVATAALALCLYLLAM